MTDHEPEPFAFGVDGDDVPGDRDSPSREAEDAPEQSDGPDEAAHGAHAGAGAAATPSPQDATPGTGVGQRPDRHPVVTDIAAAERELDALLAEAGGAGPGDPGHDGPTQQADEPAASTDTPPDPGGASWPPAVGTDDGPWRSGTAAEQGPPDAPRTDAAPTSIGTDAFDEPEEDPPMADRARPGHTGWRDAAEPDTAWPVLPGQQARRATDRSTPAPPPGVDDASGGAAGLEAEDLEAEDDDFVATFRVEPRTPRDEPGPTTTDAAPAAVTPPPTAPAPAAPAAPAAAAARQAGGDDHDHLEQLDDLDDGPFLFSVTQDGDQQEPAPAAPPRPATPAPSPRARPADDAAEQPSPDAPARPRGPAPTASVWDDPSALHDDEPVTEQGDGWQAGGGAWSSPAVDAPTDLSTAGRTPDTGPAPTPDPGTTGAGGPTATQDDDDSAPWSVAATTGRPQDEPAPHGAPAPQQRGSSFSEDLAGLDGLDDLASLLDGLRGLDDLDVASAGSRSPTTHDEPAAEHTDGQAHEHDDQHPEGDAEDERTDEDDTDLEALRAEASGSFVAGDRSQGRRRGLFRR